MGAGEKAAKARRAVRVSLWVMPASTNVLLLTCVVVLLAAVFEDHLPSSVLGGVWSGCLAQLLVMVQLPLLLPADHERVAAAVRLPLLPNRKSSISWSPFSSLLLVRKCLRIRRLPFFGQEYWSFH